MVKSDKDTLEQYEYVVVEQYKNTTGERIAAFMELGEAKMFRDAMNEKNPRDVPYVVRRVKR